MFTSTPECPPMGVLAPLPPMLMLMLAPALALLPSLAKLGVLIPDPAVDWDRDIDTIRRPNLSNFGGELLRRVEGLLVGVPGPVDEEVEADLSGVRRERAAWGSWGWKVVLGFVGCGVGFCCGEKRERERNEKGEFEVGDRGGEGGGEGEWHERCGDAFVFVLVFEGVDVDVGVEDLGGEK